MKLAIQTIDLPDEEGLVGYAELKVRAALRPLNGHVSMVRVQLADANGPALGGVDKHCMVAVGLDGLGGGVFDDVHTDVRFALDQVTARIDGWAQRRAKQLRETSQ